MIAATMERGMSAVLATVGHHLTEYLVMLAGAIRARMTSCFIVHGPTISRRRRGAEARFPAAVGVVRGMAWRRRVRYHRRTKGVLDACFDHSAECR